MNEQALQDAYNLFKTGGYNKSIGEFKTLIATNPNALKDSYDLFKSGGYNKSIEDYKVLIGVGTPVKKKEQATVSTVENGGLVSKGYNPVPSVTEVFKPSLIVPEPQKKTEIPLVKGNPLEGIDYKGNDRAYPETPNIGEFTPIPAPKRNTQEDLNQSLKGLHPYWNQGTNEEENVVPKLNYEFGDHGFKFEETGIGDAMTVTAPNGKTTTIDLDPFLSKTELAESRKLQDFIKENQRDYSKFAKIQNNYDAYNKKFLYQKEIDQAFVSLNEDTQKLSQETNAGMAKLKTLTPGTPEYNQIADGLSKQQAQYEQNKAALENNVGRYVAMKAEQGTYLGGIYNSFLEGAGNLVSGLAGIAIDTDLGYPVPLPDETKKAMKRELLPKVRESLVKNIGDENTSKEWTENAGFVHEAILGLAKSVPTMVGGGTAILPLMYAQVSDNVDKQMMDDPDFKDISEEEKLLVKVPIGIAGAALERYGFRNVLESKGLLNNIVLKAIGNSGAKTTYKSFDELIENEIQSEIAKGALRVGAGGLAEFETGASQEVVDITAKQIYNAVKEKDMFDTPESSGAWMKQVFKAGAQEAIGGIVLGSVPAISKAVKSNRYKSLDNTTVEALNIIGNDPNMLNAVENDVQIKVNTGELTPEEGESQIEDLRSTIGVVNQLPSDLTVEQQKEAIPVRKKLSELEKEKERVGKAKGLTDPIQMEIDKANEKILNITGFETVEGETGGKKIKKIKKDANKIESPVKVDDGQQAEDGKGVDKGNTQPEKPSEQGKEEVKSKGYEGIPLGTKITSTNKYYGQSYTLTDVEGYNLFIGDKDGFPLSDGGRVLPEKVVRFAYQKDLNKFQQKNETTETKPQEAIREEPTSKAEGQKDEVLETTKWSDLEKEVWDNVLSKKRGLSLPDKKSTTDYKTLIDDGIVYVDSFGGGKSITLRLTEKGESLIGSEPQVQKPIVAETKETASKPIETVELEKQLEVAQKEVSTLNDKIKAKSSELGKTFLEDQSNLFGERKSSEGKLFDTRVNPDQINKVIGELKAKRDAAVRNVRDIKEKIAKVDKEGTKQKGIFDKPEPKKPEPKKPEPKKRPSILENTRKKYGKLDELTPRTLLLRFFATGGKVNSKEAIKTTGVKAADLWGKVSNNGKSYHSLYEGVMDELGLEELDQQDFDNMLTDMLMSGKGEIFKELNQYLPKNEQEKSYDDVMNMTIEELKEEMEGVDPQYHDWFIERIGELENLLIDEVSTGQLAELYKHIEKHIVNGQIDWEGIENDNNIQTLALEANEKQDTKTEESPNGDGTSTGSEKSTGEEEVRKTFKQPISSTEELQDYGEKIGGAKKDLIKSIKDISVSDIENKPLSKSFPEPDYGKLVEDGLITEEGAILLKFLYGNIPTKPRKQYRVPSWAKRVQEVINTFKDVLEAESTKNIDFTKRIVESMQLSEMLKRDFSIFSQIMKGLGFPKEDVKLGNYTIKHFTSNSTWNKEKGVLEKLPKPKENYSIVKDNFIVKDYSSMDEAISGLKQILSTAGAKTKGTKFGLYQDRKTKEFFIGKKGAIDVVRVMAGFDTLQKASTFLKENQSELQAIWDGMKFNPEERRSANRERVGTNWRKGKNVTSEDFGTTFGFRGVEFGNWVNVAERQSHVNEAYDALMDLADVLGISPQALSLNGELGFAFGARGHGKANAHYEPGKVVINLTKMRGAGSLAHEWWHALDNYFSRNRGEKDSYITEKPTVRYNYDGTIKEGVRKEMIAAFKNVMDAINKSNIKTRSLALDRTRSDVYWSTAVEMSARSFENYIISTLGERNQRNDYLANFKETGEWINDTKGGIDALKNYPYPLEEESHAINEAYKQFFDAIEEKTNEEDRITLNEPIEGYTKTTEDGISFLSESGNNDYSEPGNVQREKSSDKGTSRSVVAVWNKVKGFNFSGTTKVKNASDVAHIMRLLEDKAVEHAFAVHVDKDGLSHIQYLSVGSAVGTVVDTRSVLAGVVKFKSKKVYLVHNHPSGNMNPSHADKVITANIRKGLEPLGINVEHIIMDTYDKKYVHIDWEGTETVENRDLSNEGKAKLEVSTMDEFLVLNKPVTKVSNSKDVAEFIQQLKFTAMPKQGALLLSRNRMIIGNHIFTGKPNLEKLVKFFGEGGIGTSIILYGNQGLSTVNKLKAELQNLDIELLDYVIVGSDSPGVVGYYRSMADEGMLRETQQKYGTNVVNEDLTNFQIENSKTLTLQQERELYNNNKEYQNLFNKDEEGSLTEKERERMQEIYRAEQEEKGMPWLGKKKTTLSELPIVTEIKSKHLTHAIGLNMGSNEMVGTFISTEPENRYKDRAKDVRSVTVDIKRPYLLDGADELITLQNRVLPRAKREFQEIVPELKTEQSFQDAKFLDDSGLEVAYNMGFNDYLAAKVTEYIEQRGYDSAYLRESEDSEGMLVVFDKSKVHFKTTPNEQIKRGIKKLKEIPNKGILRDITTLSAEMLEAIGDIAIGFARKGGNALKDFITNMRTKFGDRFKNITDKEFEGIFNKANGIVPEKPKVKGVKKTIATDNLDQLVNNVPETGAVDEYLSKGTIEHYTKESPLNDQKRGVQRLVIALEHGEKIIDEAKEMFGENYVEAMVEYLEQSTAPISNKALAYVSLENSLGREKLNFPERANELNKLQSYVYSKTQLLRREYSKSLNYQKLIKFAETGYDLSLVTDDFFSSEELENKREIEKAIQSDIDAINREAVNFESAILPEDIERLIQEGVQKEISEIHDGLTPSKKAYAKNALKALGDMRNKLRSKTYDATIGIPVAIIDAGLATIEKAIKLGATIHQAVEAGIRKIKELSGKTKWDKENEFRQDALEEFAKRMPKTQNIVKEALIKKGFGRTVNIKGVEKTILDWKKLAGAAGTVEQIQRNVESVLKDEGHSESEIESISNDLLEEYQALRESIISKAQTEIAKRNRTTVTPKQRSAAKKLAEMYNFGLFEKDFDEFENVVIKAIGAKVSEEGFNDAKKIARAMESLYASSFKGVLLNDISAKAALENLSNKQRILLYRESRRQGNGFLKLANIFRNFMEISQNMVLNNLKQAVENPLSGLQQNVIEKISMTGKSTKEMATQRRKLMKSVYADMVLHGGIGFGKVETTFVNRQHLDDWINKQSDSKLYHAIMSVATGKVTLNAMDSLFKASITEKKFASNLLRILTDPTNPQRMTKEDALSFVSEKLTGQTFEEAKETAKTVTENINAKAEQELMPTNDGAINRLANDIVKAALEMGSKVSSEQIEAAYNAAYKSAGLGLGHEPNNIVTRAVQTQSVRIEGKIDMALKEKQWTSAAMLTFQSAMWRNIVNPFVGGGTNWLVLKFEKAGGGLFTGLAYQLGNSQRIDLSTKAGLAKLEQRLFEQARYKDNYMRGLIGGAVTLSAYLLYLSADDEDKYRKWAAKNQWSARYTNTLIPESILLDISIEDKTTKRYLATLMNKNDAFDASTKILKATNYALKASAVSEGEDYVPTAKSEAKIADNKSKAWGAIGEAIGGKINAPFPWRLVKDGQVIYQGIRGEDPYHGNYKPSEGFLSGVLQGGVIEWLGFRPMPKPKPGVPHKVRQKETKLEPSF